MFIHQSCQNDITDVHQMDILNGIQIEQVQEHLRGDESFERHYMFTRAPTARSGQIIFIMDDQMTKI